MQLADTQPILAGPQLTHATMVAVLVQHRVSAAEASEIASAYETLGRLTGIGACIPLAQAIHETGWFTSARWRLSRNPAGLGATNDGSWGGHFETIAAGVAAQYAHLLAYAKTDEQLALPNRILVLLDPRLAALTKAGYRGIAPRWIDLNGRWAVPGPTYGQSILAIARTLA
jgi:hypothetical protein